MRYTIKNTITTLFFIGFICSCASKKPATVSVASFYNMGVAFVRSDANGKDYFNIYAKGSSEKECRYNAKIELIKILVTDGIAQGISIKPILNVPVDVNKFNDNQTLFYSRYTADNNVLDASGTIDEVNKLAQTEDKKAVLSMRVQVAVNRKLLEQQLKQFIKEN